MATATDLIARLCHRRHEIEGQLGYFGLGPWWSSVFTRAEQDRIEAAFHHPGVPTGGRPLTRGRGPCYFPSAAILLSVVAGCLRNEAQDRHLACRVLAKAEERAQAEEDIIGLYLVYQEIIRLHSKWRDHSFDALDLIYGACHKQITLSVAAAKAFHELHPREPLPNHVGYLTLAVLLEQEGSYSKAIEICKQARDEGWGGNWTWKIGCLARMRDEQDPRVKFASRSGLGPV
ncbi:MAG TPA: hypothetical protein PLU87_19220 [Sedimentisphaerales bacterium]|nr:hypothetical protein [Sedimentisphaerales bacterium]HRV49837.1 hypothetical protein [Sedimentisphaerales bacterium]